MGPVPDLGCEGRSLTFQMLQPACVHMFVRYRLPIKDARVSGRGHTQDFPEVSFQAMTAFDIGYQSGPFIIETGLLYIKKSRDCAKSVWGTGPCLKTFPSFTDLHTLAKRTVLLYSYNF